MSYTRTALGVLAACGAVLGVSACDDSGTARLELRLTDAPMDYVESAEIWVSHVYLQGGTDMEGEEEAEGPASGRVDLFNNPDEPLHYDLLTLQDGVTATLTEMTSIPEGPYGQLRLVVDSAKVTLKPEYQFQDGSQTAALAVPSGSSSGIKVQLNGLLVAADGSTTTMTVDAPVNENFVIQGDPENPAGIQGMSFTPVLRELTREEG